MGFVFDTSENQAKSNYKFIGFVKILIPNDAGFALISA